MLAEIVTVGDELCRGEILDTNGAYLGQQLWELDITCAWMSSCRDRTIELENVIRKACERADLVILSGGLGPTEDDLTVDVLASMAGVQAVVEPRAAARLEARRAQTGYKAADLHRQVRIPGGAEPLANETGLAPGFLLRLEGAVVIALPGPPRELRPMFAAEVAPRLTSLREAGGEVQRVATRTLRVFGRGESQVAESLDGLLEGASGASIHYRAHFPEVYLKLVVRGTDQAACKAALDELAGEARARLGLYVYGEGDTSFAEAVGARLQKRHETLATAESCTGGGLGALITAVPGSSAHYLGGAVTYANSEKVRQLGVAPSTLETHGAVSEQCVLEMAEGIRQRSGATYGVAVSGVAGPGGGSEERPVGTVWLALAGPRGGSSRKIYWPGDREQVRSLACFSALAMVSKALEKNSED